MKQFKKETYDISSEKIPAAFDKKKLVFLSDLHAVCYGDGYEKLFRRIKNEKPLAVLIGGDMVVGGSQFEDYGEVYPFLKRLAGQFPVFYAYGNHERRLRIYQNARRRFLAYQKGLERAGIHFLGNRSAVLSRNGESIRITGLDLKLDYTTKWWRAKKLSADTLKRQIRRGEDSQFEILLAHDPKHFKVYAGEGYDLVLSGHLHGGMLRLPVIGGVISPDFSLFPRYDAGEFKEGASRMIVSRGLGEHTIPVRIWNPRELSVIHLLRKENR